MVSQTYTLERKRNRPSKAVWVTGTLALIFLTLLIFPLLGLPDATGPYTVGQMILKLTDTTRPEIMTDALDDFRELGVVIWYPAEAGTGDLVSYFPHLSVVSEALVESGEVAAWEAFGLRFVRSSNLQNAEISAEESSYPVILFSPGNGTNVEFYNNLASELASHGYVVFGLNHPYDVAAVELSDGRIAPYDREQWTLSPKEHQAYTAMRVPVRVADLLFVLKQLEYLNSNTNSPFAGRLDLDSVAAAGHSLGGIAASEACQAELRIKACVNLDGLQGGGPFSMDTTGEPPTQPFLFLTKESQLHQRWIERFESTTESYWVVIHGSTHDSFSDAALLQPSLALYSGKADKQAELIKHYLLEFLGHTLKHQSFSLLPSSSAVSVNVFPAR